MTILLILYNNIDLVGDGPENQCDLGVTYLRGAKLHFNIEILLG